MTKTASPFSMYTGNKRLLDFAITDADAVDPTDPLNLTGLTAKFAISRINAEGVYSTTPVVEKSTSSGIAITNAAGGLLTVTLDGADTEALAPGNYHFELELFDSSDNSNVVSVGSIELLANVVNT